MRYRNTILPILVGAALLVAACAPAAAPSPTAAPAKPAPTTAAAKPAAQPTTAPAKAAEQKPAPSKAEGPAAKAKEKPAEQPAAKPAAKTADKPATKAAEKTAFDEQAVANFYRGKTVRIIVGFAPGGGFDTYSRVVAKHMPKFLPGNPNVIVENKPGAGSMLAANEVYKSAAKDGTVIGNFNENLVLQQALDAQGIEYDARKFQWLASLAQSPSACAASTRSGITSIQEVIDGKEWIIGADAPGTTTFDVPAVMKEALGANIKIVEGYAGTSRLRLGIENGEVDGGCWTWDSMSTTASSWFESSPPTAKVLVIMGSKTPDHPWLEGVPPAQSLAKTDETKRLLAAINAPSEIVKPYAVAPEVPKERVQALRQAFDSLSTDKDFLADIKQAKLDLAYSSADQVEATVQELLDTPRPVLDKLKSILS